MPGVRSCPEFQTEIFCQLENSTALPISPSLLVHMLQKVCQQRSPFGGLSQAVGLHPLGRGQHLKLLQQLPYLLAALETSKPCIWEH